MLRLLQPCLKVVVGAWLGFGAIFGLFAADPADNSTQKLAVLVKQLKDKDAATALKPT